MSNFKKNPKKPFEIKVPNKIRKRIAMHEKREFTLKPTFLRKSLGLPPKPTAKKRGSLWSRFSNRVEKFLK